MVTDVTFHSPVINLLMSSSEMIYRIISRCFPSDPVQGLSTITLVYYEMNEKEQ